MGVVSAEADAGADEDASWRVGFLVVSWRENRGAGAAAEDSIEQIRQRKPSQQTDRTHQSCVKIVGLAGGNIAAEQRQGNFTRVEPDSAPRGGCAMKLERHIARCMAELVRALAGVRYLVAAH